MLRMVFSSSKYFSLILKRISFGKCWEGDLGKGYAYVISLFFLPEAS